MAMMFSAGCQAVCRIFLVKSKLSTLMSSRRRLHARTRRGLSTARGGFAALPRGLQGHIPLGVPVKHAEEVVVGSSHDDAGGRRRGGMHQLGPGGGGRKPAAPSQGCRAITAGNGDPVGADRDRPASSHLLWGGVGGSSCPHHIWAASAHKLRAGSWTVGLPKAS